MTGRFQEPAAAPRTWGRGAVSRRTVLLAAFAAPCLAGCRRSGDAGTAGSGGHAGHAKTVIENAGSDTMVNLAQAWAEEYAEVVPAISIEVSGGGSGTGLAALINGTVDIANSSRKIEPSEIERARQSTGKEPQQ